MPDDAAAGARDMNNHFNAFRRPRFYVLRFFVSLPLGIFARIPESRAADPVLLKNLNMRLIRSGCVFEITGLYNGNFRNIEMASHRLKDPVRG